MAKKREVAVKQDAEDRIERSEQLGREVNGVNYFFRRCTATGRSN